MTVIYSHYGDPNKPAFFADWLPSGDDNPHDVTISVSCRDERGTVSSDTFDLTFTFDPGGAAEAQRAIVQGEFQTGFGGTIAPNAFDGFDVVVDTHPWLDSGAWQLTADVEDALGAPTTATHSFGIEGASNIREDSFDDFEDHDWLLEKVNACMASETSLSEKPTAEYANEIDATFKQMSEAFNGFPVNAQNVNGHLQLSKTTETAGGQTKEYPLLKDIPVGTWVYVEAHAYAYLTNTDDPNIFSARAFFHRIAENTMQIFAQESAPVYPANPPCGFELEVSATDHDQAIAKLTGHGTLSADWTIDYEVRATPVQLPLPGAFEEQGD